MPTREESCSRERKRGPAPRGLFIPWVPPPRPPARGHDPRPPGRVRTTQNLARTRPASPAAKGYSSPLGPLLRTRGWADTAGRVGTVALGEGRVPAPTQAHDTAPGRADWTRAGPSPALLSWGRRDRRGNGGPLISAPRYAAAVSRGLPASVFCFFAPDYTDFSLRSAFPRTESLPRIPLLPQIPLITSLFHEDFVSHIASSDFFGRDHWPRVPVA